MEHCLLLDLKHDPALIAQYEKHHEKIWPEVEAHLRAQGVLSMRIYRLGTRLCMVMQTDDERFDAARMAQAESADAKLREWEELMWRFQAPTPWTPEGAKWVRADRIFDFAAR